MVSKEAKSLAEKLDILRRLEECIRKQVRRKPGSVESLINSLSKVKNKSAHFSGKGKNIGPLNRDPYKHENGCAREYRFESHRVGHGKNLRTPQTLVYEEWMEEGNTSQSVVEYILQLNNRLKRCQDIAITRMKECQLKRKTWYDRDVVERKFVEGDLVMVLVTSKQNKLEDQCTWPWAIVYCLNSGSEERQTGRHNSKVEPAPH
ncbi:retrovirus-related Pol polyprotein from transposon 412 [Trichonephila clavipes]|nr:retrovirus-related Pol polyprotein from transposon 412 [Trichonephila clavipes]